MFTYNIVATGIAIAVLIALGVAAISLILVVMRWKQPTRRRHIVRLVTALALIPCLAAIQYATLYLSLRHQQMGDLEVSRAARLDESSNVGEGDDVPRLQLKTIDGHSFALHEEGKLTLINFFATWCGPCRLELPHIERIWNENRDNTTFRLLVIGREETIESVQEYCKENGFTFPAAADSDRSVFSAFATESIPRTVVVGPDGRIVYSKAGFQETDIDKLNALLREQLAAIN